MDYQTLFYPESRFGGFSDVDGTIAFAQRVRALLNSEDIVLDVGCGRGVISDDPIPRHHELVVLRGKAAKVVGIDIDPAASGNPFIDEFLLIGEDQKWPLEDQSIDLCVCDSVLEHIKAGMFAGPLGRSTFTPPKSSFDSPLYGLVSLRRSQLRGDEGIVVSSAEPLTDGARVQVNR